MSHADQVRSFWEARIPQGEILVLGDAERFINRGLPRRIISRRALQRAAASGAMVVLGGPDTAVKHYRVTRANLIAFLCGLDSLITAADIERISRAAEQQRPSTPPRESPAPRRGQARPASPRRQPLPQQRNLFDE